MADQRSRLTMDILARVRGTGDVDRLARSIDHTGDEMSEAARDAMLLDKAIDDVTDELRRMNAELLRTGDIELFDKSRGARSTLSMLKRMRRELGNVDVDARKAGRTIGDVLGALPSQLKGGLIIGLVAGAAAAAPLIGGAVSAAVIGSVGAGGILGGVAAAAQDPRVGQAARGMVAQIEPEFQLLGRSFVGPAMRSLDLLGDTASDLLRELRPELAALAPVAEQLAEGVAGLAREMAPGIAAALHESVPILQALARELPGLGRDLASVFGIIAGGGDDARDALVATINLVGLLAKSSAVAIRGFTELFGLLEDSANNAVLGGFARLATELLGTSDASVKMLRDTNELGDGMAGKLVPALEETEESLRAQEVQSVNSANSLAEAAAAAGGLTDALNILNGGILTAREAERGFQAAIDDATASIEDNGRTLDINTEQGRNNQAALDRIAESAIQLADATLERTGSEEKATEVLEDGRRALIKAAEAMGLSRKEAKKLADELLRIPKRITTRVDVFYDLHNRPPALDPGSGASRPGIQRRWGGITLPAQTGLLRRADIFSPVAPARFAFAEPATGGEAFIPRRGDRSRSLGILSEAARWYGARVVGGGGGQAMGHTTHVHVTAYSDRFSLQQIMDDLAMRGVN